MISQRAWNDYEISLLIEYFWKIENKEMNSKNPYGRMSAYKDAMKNLLEFVSLNYHQNIIIIK